MGLQKLKRQARLQEWASLIRAREESGMTVRGWCEATGICVKKYYYRLKRVQEECLEALENARATQSAGLATTAVGQLQQHEAPVFMPVHMPQSKGAALTVWIGNCAVDIQNGADAAMVEHVLKAVSRL
jgi:hypothetical protein